MKNIVSSLFLSGKTILTFFCSAVLTAAEPVTVAPRDILFLAHFDQSTEPAVGNTEGMRCSAQITGGTKGFPFGGSTRQEALDLNGPGICAWPAS